jgi:hypothetical protein
MPEQPINNAALGIISSQSALAITAALDRNWAALLTNTVEVIRALRELQGAPLDEKTVMKVCSKGLLRNALGFEPEAASTCLDSETSKGLVADTT